MQPKRIDIEQCDLKNEKCTEGVYLYIEFCENYLLYAGEYYSTFPKDVEDLSLGNEDKYHKFIDKVKIDRVSSMSINWSNTHSLYYIEIDVTGKSENMIFFFKKEKDAQFLFNKLDEFIFGKQTS